MCTFGTLNRARIRSRNALINAGLVASRSGTNFVLLLNRSTIITAMLRPIVDLRKGPITFALTMQHGSFGHFFRGLLLTFYN